MRRREVEKRRGRPFRSDAEYIAWLQAVVEEDQALLARAAETLGRCERLMELRREDKFCAMENMVLHRAKFTREDINKRLGMEIPARLPMEEAGADGEEQGRC